MLPHISSACPLVQGCPGPSRDLLLTQGAAHSALVFLLLHKLAFRRECEELYAVYAKTLHTSKLIDNTLCGHPSLLARLEFGFESV